MHLSLEGCTWTAWAEPPPLPPCPCNSNNPPMVLYIVCRYGYFLELPVCIFNWLLLNKGFFSISVQVFPDNFMRREVCSFVVHCTFTDDGCKWIGEVRHLEVKLWPNGNLWRYICSNIFKRCNVLLSVFLFQPLWLLVLTVTCLQDRKSKGLVV